jgi:hypothetical protein
MLMGLAHCAYPSVTLVKIFMGFTCKLSLVNNDSQHNDIQLYDTQNKGLLGDTQHK